MLGRSACADVVRAHDEDGARRIVHDTLADAAHGAQPTEVLRGALERAWAEQPADVADGPACGPDGSDAC